MKITQTNKQKKITVELIIKIALQQAMDNIDGVVIVINKELAFNVQPNFCLKRKLNALVIN